MQGTQSTAMEAARRLYVKSRIDYAQHYATLYASFNGWYLHVTRRRHDRLAINDLKKYCLLFDRYERSEALRTLRPLMVKISEFTQREPFPDSSSYWNGEVNGVLDWRSLLEYWYRVRCRIVHGTEVRAEYVHLAYETLSVFMEEALIWAAEKAQSNTVYNTSKKRYN